MAKFEEHCEDCQRLLGDRCEEVNRWMDAKYAQFGPLHRFARHHVTGANDAGVLFGELGRKAALIHILRDCGHIPTWSDWRTNKRLNHLGMVNVPGEPGWNFDGVWDRKQFDEAAKQALENNFEKVLDKQQPGS